MVHFLFKKPIHFFHQSCGSITSTIQNPAKFETCLKQGIFLRTKKSSLLAHAFDLCMVIICLYVDVGRVITHAIIWSFTGTMTMTDMVPDQLIQVLIQYAKLYFAIQHVKGIIILSAQRPGCLMWGTFSSIFLMAVLTILLLLQNLYLIKRYWIMFKQLCSLQTQSFIIQWNILHFLKPF